MKLILHFSSIFPLIRITLSALALLGLLVGCGLNSATQSSELALVDLSAAEELALGRIANLQIIQQSGGSYLDQEFNTYFNLVGQRLAHQASRSDLSFHFTITNDSTPNAFALPGGYILLSRGLLVTLSSEAELAALLAHEIGHVTARHLLQGGAHQAIRPTSDSLGCPADDLVASLQAMRYTPAQEAEAERRGIDIMILAGFDPQGAVQLQEDFYREGGKGDATTGQTGFFQSHPFSVDRRDEDQRYIEDNYPLTNGTGQQNLEFTQATQSLKRTRQGYILCDEAHQLETQGQVAEAIALYHRALFEAPEEPLILTSLGLAYLRNEDLVPARRYLIKAINRQADYYRSRLALGYIYQQKKEHLKALEQLELGFKLRPTFEGGFMLAEARNNAGDKEGARRLYLAVAKADAAGKLGRNALERLKMLGQ